MKTKPKWMASPGAEYIQGVLDESIPACESIRLGVERAVRDHEKGHERGLIYKPKRAQYAINFMKLCRHTLGKWRGKPFIHAPWQAFITGELFGWYREDTEFRRFNTAMIFVPKKNGKSTYLAPLGIFMLYGDKENGAQVYSLATKYDQARIIFDEARAMVMGSPDLKQVISVQQHTLAVIPSRSIMAPMASNVNTVDGFNPSCQLVDELHRHKSRYLWDLIENASGARDQPLTVGITTAGDDVSSICYEQFQYSLNILRGSFENDDFFAYVSTPDKDYDWQDEEQWYKLNPGLGITLNIESIRKQAKKASQQPQASLAFRRYRMNEWVNEVGRWLELSAWAECSGQIDLDDLKGEKCYGGLDLALSRDMSAFVLVFEVEDYWAIYPRFYCPEKSVMERAKKDNIPYDVWVDQGVLTATPGNVTDFDYIERDILACDMLYNVQEVGYDPHIALQLATTLLGKGVNMVEVRQGAMSLNEPMQLFLRKVLAKKIVHNDNPILSWNAQNIVARTNPNMGIAPDKARSTDRIDGLAATFNAVNRMISTKGKKKRSVYEDRQPEVLRMYQ